ncbi:hypothetical protein L208DRAFT_1282083, partial [Tricholoma matsutake]
LFFRFCRFLKIPATLIFMFDGPACPSVKRSKNVVDTPLWLLSYIKFLITAFGFYIHEAPGEAKAELAMLNQLRIINVIITNDSDAFVFGSKCVIRSRCEGQSPLQVGEGSAQLFTTTTPLAL